MRGLCNSFMSSSNFFSPVVKYSTRITSLSCRLGSRMLAQTESIVHTVNFRWNVFCKFENGKLEHENWQGLVRKCRGVRTKWEQIRYTCISVDVRRQTCLHKSDTRGPCVIHTQIAQHKIIDGTCISNILIFHAWPGMGPKLARALIWPLGMKTET